MKTRSIIQFSEELDRRYEMIRVRSFKQRKFTPEEFQEVLKGIVKDSSGSLAVREAGLSFEGRPISVVSAGEGKTKILLWSQMHGDEPTATMAIADVLDYFFLTLQEQPTRDLLASLTLWFVPMLNPDGASRFQRRTAQGIDMNRDALALVTPEARVLNQIHDEFRPEFGFNLHDQELSTVASSKELTAIALLTPALDAEKSDNDVRRRAKHLGSCFAEVLKRFAPGHIARYDDTFEPRAFGDNMQQRGTSTLLVESGHSLGDPEKNGIRKLNVIGILSSLSAIASGEYRSFDHALYDTLPINGKKAYDVIIHNILSEHPNGKVTPLDIAISYQVDTHSESIPLLIDIGDLHTYVGIKELDGQRKRIPHESLQIGKTFEWEKVITPPL